LPNLAKDVPNNNHPTESVRNSFGEGQPDETKINGAIDCAAEGAKLDYTPNQQFDLTEKVSN